MTPYLLLLGICLVLAIAAPVCGALQWLIIRAWGADLRDAPDWLVGR